MNLDINKMQRLQNTYSNVTRHWFGNDVISSCVKGIASNDIEGRSFGTYQPKLKLPGLV